MNKTNTKVLQGDDSKQIAQTYGVILPEFFSVLLESAQPASCAYGSYVETWQNTSNTQLRGGMNNWFYAAMTIFAQQFIIFIPKLVGITAPFAPAWLRSWQQWQVAMWFDPFCGNCKPAVQLTAKSIAYKLFIPLAPHKFEQKIIFWWIDVFFFTSAIQCRNIWSGIEHLTKILPLLRQMFLYSFRPSVNLSCDYEIIFHDRQQSYLKWELCHSKWLSFIFF